MLRNAQAMASGNNIASSDPNSMGWMAVPEGRVNPSRSCASNKVTSAERPGIDIWLTHLLWVKNWKSPNRAIAQPAPASRPRRRLSRSRLLMPS